MSVYKPCDIRGPVAELSADLYRSWGASIARRLRSGGAVFVGGDVRVSTPAFKAALIEGLAAGGVAVRDLGILPTPMVYWAGRQYGAAACAIVTASHSPPDINGLKWVIGELPPTAEQVKELAEEATAPHPDPLPPTTRERGPDRLPARGSARLRSPLPAGGSRVGRDAEGSWAAKGQGEGEEDLAAAYLEWMRVEAGKWPIPAVDRGSVKRRLAAMTVILDPGNGCWAGRCGPYLRALFPGTRVEVIHDRPDGTFPERDPDSARAEHLGRLRDRVVAERADLGIAFDGDGDRLSYADGTGAVLTAEQATWVLLQFFGPALAGRPVVYDIKFADLVANAVRALGGEPRVERSGHAFIRTRMIREAGLFGAEVSGHYFYGDLHGADDGFYSAARMLWHLAAGDKPLAAWRAECPAVFLTPDLRVRVDPKEAARWLAEARRAFADQPIGEVDGLRIEFADGWALMRGSVTEPAITFRFEGRNAAALERVVATFCGRMGELGKQVAEKYGRARPSPASSAGSSTDR